MTTALITGATSGIGLATAEAFAQNKINLILCGRRKDRLEEIQKKLSKLVHVDTLAFDVRNNEEVTSAIASLGKKVEEIDILINNAGNAHGLAPIDKASIGDMDAMIDINVKGLLYVSHAIIPHMVEKKKGTIINLSSIAGKEVYPNGNVYCASKHAVDAITKGMRVDLNPYGIRVCSINPGMVETEFSLVRFKGDAEKAKNVYKGLDPLVGKDIADTILFVVTRPPHVMIADLTIFPTAQGSATVVTRKA